MGILRTENRADKDPYVRVLNQWVRDDRLSWDSRGLLAWLQSHEIGFKVTVKSIVSAGPAGRTAVRRMINELVEYGYLRRAQARDEDGKFGEIDYEMCDPFDPANPQVSTEVTKPDHGHRAPAHQARKPQVSTEVAKPDHGQTTQTVNPQVSTEVRFPGSGQPDIGSPDHGTYIRKQSLKNFPDAARRDEAEQTSLIVAEASAVAPKQINGGAVAAAYVDAYRAAHDGATPPHPPAKIGAEAKRMLGGGHDPAELLAAAELMGGRGLSSLAYALQQLRKPQRGRMTRADHNDAVLLAELGRARAADAAEPGWGHTA